MLKICTVSISYFYSIKIPNLTKSCLELLYCGLYRPINSLQTLIQIDIYFLFGGCLEIAQSEVFISISLIQ